MLTYHTVIIGAGASGLFCAGSFNAPKIILDHNRVPGVKLGVSGGGKCNFTNRFATSANYLSQRKHFCKNALAAFKPTDFVHLLQEQNISYEERNHGQLFAHKAQDIVQFLVKRAKQANTDFSLCTQVFGIEQGPAGFMVRTSSGLLQAQHVVLATGGLSYPALGAGPFGIQMARQFNLSVIEQRPALCGLTFPKELRPLCKALAGNSTRATVQINKHTYTEQLLFTHEGISGPAVLSASLRWKEGEPVQLNLLPDLDILAWLSAHKTVNKKVSALLNLPGHMAQIWLGRLDRPLANASKQDLQEIVKQLTRFQFIPTSTSGYTKAEVTAGGIDTQEINPSTFEVKKVPDLYIIGELLDVTGELGGFNLHWAWASGYCAGQDLAKKI